MDWVAAAARERPDAPAVVTAERTITYAELDRLATNVAGIVLDSGLGPGEAVAFWGERDLATVAAVWGIPRAGATAVPIDPDLAPEVLRSRVRSVGARGLWAIPDFDVDRLLERRAPDTKRHRPGLPHPDARFVLHTSGSSGAPKAVPLTGAMIDAATAASQARVGNHDRDRWLAVLPMFHVAGLSVLWRSARAGGAVALESDFDVDRVVELCRSGAVTVASFVPTMVHRLLAAADGGFGSLRLALVGGGRAERELIEAALEAGFPAVTTYGMTETTSQVCTVVPGDERASLGTVGAPVDGAEVRIAGDGRIEIRGPMVSSGYLGDRPRPDGEWFTTNDLGHLDDAGRLVVTGRADRIIVTGGENVSAEEVERVLATHPAVDAVAVRGEPDTEWGMVVVAAIVLSDVPLEQVLTWARDHLPGPGVPKRWEVVDELPEKLDR